MTGGLLLKWWLREGPSVMKKWSRVSIFGCLGLAGIAALAIACNPQPQLSVSSTYLLDDMVANPADFPIVSRSQLLTSLSQGDLISMGESHESGLERLYLAQLYSDLAPRVNPLPVQCLVETGGTPGQGPGYASLLDMQGPKDPVRAQFEKICSRDKEFDNPHNDYTAELAKYLPEGRVLTHTGMRHIAPWGLLYPFDFLSPQWVDTPEHGTINRQIPDSFIAKNEQIRAHGVMAYEDLMLPELQAQLIAALKGGSSPEQAAQAAEAEVTKLMALPVLQFASGESAHIVEIHRMNLSYPNLIMYFSLLNHPSFSPDALKTLLASQEMQVFLKEIDPGSLQIGVLIPNDSNEEVVLGNSVDISAAGTIYFQGQLPKSGAPVFAMITPGQQPELGPLSPAQQAR